MRRTLWTCALASGMVATILSLALPGPAAAGGLRCSVGEVVVENLKIGQTYSLKTLANLPLTLTYTGERATRVKIEPLIPDSSELRHGAESIPALAWASALPSLLALAPGETGTSDLTLTIPDDEQLMGRKFQVVFWSHTLAQAGDMLAYGLKSRIIFSIDRERETPGVSPHGDLSITLQPGHLRLRGVVPGKAYRLEELTASPLMIRNTSDKPVTVELRATSPKHEEAKSSGSDDLLTQGSVVLTPARLILQPGEERAVSGTVSIARGRSSKDKDLMCVISASVTGQEVATEIQSRLLVHAR